MSVLEQYTRKINGDSLLEIQSNIYYTAHMEYAWIKVVMSLFLCSQKNTEVLIVLPPPNTFYNS